MLDQAVEKKRGIVVVVRLDTYLSPYLEAVVNGSYSDSYFGRRRSPYSISLERCFRES